MGKDSAVRRRGNGDAHDVTGTRSSNLSQAVGCQARCQGSDDVISAESCDSPAAILTHRGGHLDKTPGITPVHINFGECLPDLVLLFHTPTSNGIPSIPVYDICASGACDCSHLVGSQPAQLLPCRVA